MKKKLDSATHEMRRESSKFQKGETKQQRANLAKVLTANDQKNNIYDLKLSDNLLVKAKFPKVEEDIETRELKIREDMQIIFEYVYGIKSSVAIIMANMNIKDETIEEFCEKYGLTGYLPEAKKLYSEISAKSIEFDSGNIRASVKIDGKYYRETKFTNGAIPETTSPENLNFEKIEIDQTDKNAVVERMKHLVDIFEEELVAAKGQYKFELDIKQSDITSNSKIKPYYEAFIIGEDEVDGIEFPKKAWKTNPVFEIKLKEHTGKYYLDYNSNYFPYNSSKARLFNDVAIRDHIKKGLLLAIHCFTTNVVKKI